MALGKTTCFSFVFVCVCVCSRVCVRKRERILGVGVQLLEWWVTQHLYVSRYVQM